MAFRAAASHPAGQEYASGCRVRLADVCAHAAGQPPSDDWAPVAAQVAEGRSDVVADWSGAPTVGWDAAARLVVELREQAQLAQAERAARQAARDQVEMSLPPGVIAISRPGEREQRAPWMADDADAGLVVRP